MVELDTVEAFDRHVAEVGSLREVAVQGKLGELAIGLETFGKVESAID